LGILFQTFTPDFTKDVIVVVSFEYSI
jgi:hypothetical protein